MSGLRPPHSGRNRPAPTIITSKPRHMECVVYVSAVPTILRAGDSLCDAFALCSQSQP